MVAQRFVRPVLLFVLGAAISAQTTAATLPPAPYKPLPVGTTLDYGWWRCVVKASDGFETVCADWRRTARYFGKFILHGQQDADGYGGATAVVPIRGGARLSISEITASAEARRAIQKLWPLAIGNRAHFVLRHGSDREDRIEVAMEVTATERLRIAGRERDVYVVRAKRKVYANLSTADLSAFSGGAGYRPSMLDVPPYSGDETWWYDPEDGIVVKAKLVWEGFHPNAGFGYDYELVRATIPDQPVTADAVTGTDASARASRTAVAGPPSAPYKPLPVGTRLDYGSWHCAVERSDGFETVCADRKRSAAAYGIFVALYDTPMDTFMGSVAETACGVKGVTYAPLSPVSIGTAGRKTVEAFWPLRVGRKIEFAISTAGGPAKVRLRVDRTEAIRVAGKQRTTYVVVQTAELPQGANNVLTPCYPKYQRTSWYDPLIGAIVRDRMRWLNGPNIGIGWNYDLVALRGPQPAPVAQATSTRVAPAVPAAAAKVAPSRPPPVRDTEPPAITVPRALSISTAVAEISGRVSDRSRVFDVTVDGRPVAIERDGRFRVRRAVPLGASTIVIAALDEWGNRATRTVSVTREAPAAAVAATTARTPSRDPLSDIHFGGYRALVIGNNDYRDLPGLRTAANDARAVAAVLKAEYGFEVDLLLDATRRDIFEALARMRAQLTFDDNLLIYYAGHGVLDEVAQVGYWLPVDADRNVQANWVSNGDVTSMLRAIRARHIMVVADSCYAGTLVRSAGIRLGSPEGREAWIKRMNRKRSRTALVSGGLEPVADSGGGAGRQHSVFARAFLAALRENAGVMDGNALFNWIKRPVVLDADQTPQYADIRRAGHDGGDFLFVRRR